MGKNCKFRHQQKGASKMGGTRTCYSRHYWPGNKINKPPVEILAVNCDGGIPECDGDYDEIYCDDKEILSRYQLCEYSLHFHLFSNSNLSLLFSPLQRCHHHHLRVHPEASEEPAGVPHQQGQGQEAAGHGDAEYEEG